MTALQLAPGAAVPLRYMNRHALITGATGTGKTVTLAAMIEGLAGAGVPVLALDAKGDLESLGNVLCPYGERGRRAPLDLFRLGPEIMARALDLSEAQAGALYVLHALAETEGWPLATVQDLRDLCQHAARQHRDISERFGLITPTSLAAVQRGLFRLDAGAFGRPGLDIGGSRGVTVYAVAKLARKPEQYAAAVAWLLLDLYERSPERGDLGQPALAVVIDEAHLVFEGIPASLEKRLASVARLIRSKGVALIWASQSPGDLPPAIAGQCLTRIQHGLRANTAQQLRDVRAAAESLPGGGPDTAETILSLGVGHALISLPDDRGTPQPCKHVQIKPGKVRPRPDTGSTEGRGKPISPPGCRPDTGSTEGRGKPISPPGCRPDTGSTAKGLGFWIHPLRFIAWTCGLVGVIAFFG